MKLTNTMRDAFVRSVMNDVPKIDYDEQIQNLALESIKRVMPHEVLAAYHTNHSWINTEHFNLPGAGWRRRPSSSHGHPEIREEDAVKLRELRALSDAQDKLHEDLESKIRGAAYACSTNKKLLELLPEFEKYIPKDEAAAVRTLPVVQNVVADFVKAGWPKAAK